MIVKKIRDNLRYNGIETRIYNPTLLHKLKFFTDINYVLPNTEHMHSKILCLPTHEKITDMHIDIIAKTIKRYIR